MHWRSFFGVGPTMAMAARILAFFVCEFVCGFGAFVFSPVPAPPPAKPELAADTQWKGRTMAEQLQQVKNLKGAAG